MKFMKKLLNAPLLLISICMMLVFSCEKDNYDNTCGVDDPTKELAWLKGQIEYIEQMNPEDSKYYYYKMASYEGATVFIPGNCNPVLDMVYIVLDCSGERIGIIGYGEDYINPDQLTDEIVIWQSVNSECIFQ